VCPAPFSQISERRRRKLPTTGMSRERETAPFLSLIPCRSGCSARVTCPLAAEKPIATHRPLCTGRLNLRGCRAPRRPKAVSLQQHISPAATPGPRKEPRNRGLQNCLKCNRCQASVSPYFSAISKPAQGFDHTGTAIRFKSSVQTGAGVEVELNKQRLCHGRPASRLTSFASRERISLKERTFPTIAEATKALIADQNYNDRRHTGGAVAITSGSACRSHRGFNHITLCTVYQSALGLISRRIRNP